jgi:two-component system sensor histidine kinase VicK
MVTISVTDTGEGISAEDIPKLFQKFGLVKESYATNQNVSQGTGLGLYISKSIVELHGGAIWASSEGKGKGTTFRFTVPVFSEEGYLKSSEVKNPNGLEIIHNTL